VFDHQTVDESDRKTKQQRSGYRDHCAVSLHKSPRREARGHRQGGGNSQIEGTGSDGNEQAEREDDSDRLERQYLLQSAYTQEQVRDPQ
jgi:hypothetical protein